VSHLFDSSALLNKGLKKMKKVIFPLFIILFWIGTIAFLHLSLLEWINVTFLIGLISGLIAISVKIIHTGFLRLFMSGFKKLNMTMMPKSRSLQQVDEELENNEDIIQFKHNLSMVIYKVTLQFSILTISLSVIGLFVFYK
jgi:Domain of unknown function (DUF3899)